MCVHCGGRCLPTGNSADDERCSTALKANCAPWADCRHPAGNGADGPSYSTRQRAHCARAAGPCRPTGMGDDSRT
eukprot:665552-Alexandrium_andersonii.AAC.1